MIMQDIRSQFPFFAAHPDLTYLDSAATTQKPLAVIDAVVSHLSASANAGRGTYALANRAERKIQDVRDTVSRFLNANGSHEIVFTSGATESLNLVALSWGLSHLKDGDEILYCKEDHASAVLPWVRLKETLAERGITIHLVPFAMSDAGDVSAADVIALVGERTRLIALTHVHNVFGDKANVQNIRKGIPPHVRISLDASQSAGHVSLDVQTLGADFVSFSGHKMFAPEGIGILWVHEDLHDSLSPVKVGGGGGSMDETKLRLDARKMPYLLEAGTYNATGIVGLGAAIQFMNQVGIEEIARHMNLLTRTLIDKLRITDRVELLPGVADSGCMGGFGIVSFRIEGMTSQEAGFVLAERGILVRTGSHCAAKGDREHDAIRVSFHAYNTLDDIDRLIDALSLFA